METPTLDIVERLRIWADNSLAFDDANEVHTVAANEIERLQARVAELEAERAALVGVLTDPEGSPTDACYAAFDVMKLPPIVRNFPDRFAGQDI